MYYNGVQENRGNLGVSESGVKIVDELNLFERRRRQPGIRSGVEITEFNILT